MDNKYHVQSNMDKYPFFKDPSQVMEEKLNSVFIIIVYIYLQIYEEMQQICSTQNLRAVVSEAWTRLWSGKILEQAKIEKESNSRLRQLMDGVAGTCSLS